MQVQKLLKLLTQLVALSPEDILDLELLIQEYPYFYLAHALLAQGAYVQGEDVEQFVVQRAATYATDRAHLQAWLEHKLTLPQLTRKGRTKSTQELHASTNTYLEAIAKKSLKKSTNETSIKQFSVIDAIVNENLQFDPFVEVVSSNNEASPIDLSERGSVLDDRFATETLANIMVQQKKYKRAIEIYEYLMLKYPEKKPYLNDIVASLKQ